MLGRSNLGICGLHSAACVAENIQLPRCVKSDVVEIKIQRDSSNGRETILSITISRVACGTSDGGPMRSSNNSDLGAGLAYSCLRDAEYEVGLVGGRN